MTADPRQARAGAPDQAGARLGPARTPVEVTEAGHRLRFGGGTAGIERLAASLAGGGFSPHRHDTYAIGVTRRGVQAFRYRGQLWHCLPGQWHILHPDELHDGVSGTTDGFGYRIVYLDPALVQEALGGHSLPFVADPVIPAGKMDPALAGYLAEIDDPLDDVEAVELTSVIAALLRRHAPARPGRRAPLHLDGLRRVRDLVREDPTTRQPMSRLEQVSGLDRWTLARQFRAAFGTTPTRYRTMRQLDLARRLLRAGQPLAGVAAAAGFADQSHLTRMFKRAYGLTPGVWSAALAGAPPTARTAAVWAGDSARDAAASAGWTGDSARAAMAWATAAMSDPP